MTKEVDHILFIGTTLYTDYKLLASCPEEYAKLHATNPRYGMNDFDLGYTNDLGNIRHLRPTDYQHWFMESKKEIMKAVVKNPDKKIVLITHHCPSLKCCEHSQVFNGDIPEVLLSSYASNLEPFITAHPNIKLWICGHAHRRQNFKLGSCLVMMNPRGHGVETYGFNPNTYVDTKTWTCTEEPFHNSQWEQERQKEFNELLTGTFWDR